MILTPEIQKQITDAIAARPEAPLVLPDHAYGTDGKVHVRVDGLPIDLHRHLHNLLIRPLEYGERMHDQSGVRGNVNPHLYKVMTGGRRPDTHCGKGHPYAGNEMPPNSRGYRCRQCYEDSLPEPSENRNSAKTHCPHGHPYDEENTKVDSTGRRRCIICTRKAKRDYAQRIRNARKEHS